MAHFFLSSEHLLTSQCVLSHLNDILGLQCTYDGIHRAIWERNYQTNIVDVLQLMSFPGSDCSGRLLRHLTYCSKVTLSENLTCSEHFKPGAIARSVAMLLGNQEAPRSILASSTSFREDLVMKIFLRPFFLFH